MRIFLGGTCNGSKWRESGFIPYMPKEITAFNPVVEEWNEAAQEKERYEREHCDFCLYVITPKMTGVYSIAEAVEDSIKRPLKTVFCVHNSDFINYKDTSQPPPLESMIQFSTGQLKSLDQVGKMIRRNGGKYFDSIKEAVWFFNAQVDYEG